MTNLDYVLFGASVIDDGWEFYPDWKAYLIREFDEVDESRMDDLYEASQFVVNYPRKEWRSAAESYIERNRSKFPDQTLVSKFPSQTLDEKQPTKVRVERRKTRPVGVMILSVLQLIGGLGILVIFAIMFGKALETAAPFEVDGLPYELLVLAFVFLGVIGVVSGVGMFFGTRWGWWCSAFYYIYGVARNAYAFLLVAELSDEMVGSERGPEYYYFKHGGRVIIHALLTMYFFRDNVLEYFGLTELKKKKAFGLLCTATILMSVLFSVFAT